MFPFFGSSSSHKTITHNLEVVIKWDLIEQFTVELLVCNQCSEDSVPSTEYPSSLKLFVVITWFTNYLLCYYYLIHQLFMLLLSDSPTIWLIMLHSFQYPKIRWGTRWMQIYINQCVHEIPQWKACKIRHYLFIIPGAMASIKYTEGSAPPFLPSLPQQPCNNNLFQERPGSKPLSSRKVV